MTQTTAILHSLSPFTFVSDASQMTLYTSSNEVTVLSLSANGKIRCFITGEMTWAYLHYQSLFIMIAVANVITEIC